jgi:hypothetical protein
MDYGFLTFENLGFIFFFWSGMCMGYVAGIMAYLFKRTVLTPDSHD